eukprot:910158-Rhodomonas_salina.1
MICFAEQMTRRGTLLVSERLGQRVQEITVTGEAIRIWCCAKREAVRAAVIERERARRAESERANRTDGAETTTPTTATAPPLVEGPAALWGEPRGLASCCRARVFVADS